MQTLTGHVLLNLPERGLDLPAGCVAGLDQGVLYDIVAVDDSAFLLWLIGGAAQHSGHTSEIDGLREEHRLFTKILDFISGQIALFHCGEEPDYELLEDVFFYMTNYPDRFHHIKEDLVFAKIAERVPEARVHVEDLARQHRLIAANGARFLASIEDALHGTLLLREAVEQPALEYIAFYRSHMALEERAIFPLCEQHLREEDWTQINQAAKTEEDPLFGVLVEERYRALYRQVAESLDRSCRA